MTLLDYLKLNDKRLAKDMHYREMSPPWCSKKHFLYEFLVNGTDRQNGHVTHQFAFPGFNDSVRSEQDSAANFFCTIRNLLPLIIEILEKSDHPELEKHWKTYHKFDEDE